MAADPSRETDARVTAGFIGPIPATSGWNRSLAAAPGAPTRVNGEILCTKTRQRRCYLICGVAVRLRIQLQEAIFRIPRPRGRPSPAHPSRGGFRRKLSDGRTRDTGPSCHLLRHVGNVAAMGIYAKRPAKMIGQVFGQFVLLWTVGWAIIGIFVHRVIEILAVPARETARTATRLAENLS